MKLDLKKEKLTNFANSVLNDPKNKKEITYILKKLKVNKKEILKSYIDYDTGVLNYDNSIYESLSLRVALYLHYLLEESWHQERQEKILKILNMSQPRKIADIGFGAPTKYIKEYVLKNKKIKLTLFDLYPAAFEFAKTLFEIWDAKYENSIKFKKTDMNSFEYVGDYELYIFQDSIEHVNNPTKYLKMIVKKSPINSKFLLSLPICPLIPSHNIAWNNKNEANFWIEKCGLKIEYSQDIHVNPKVDLFAENLNGLFNYIVLCSKLK